MDGLLLGKIECPQYVLNIFKSWPKDNHRLLVTWFRIDLTTQRIYQIKKGMKWLKIGYVSKVQIFWEGHKILQNLQLMFDRYYIEQIYGGDFAEFCGLLRISNYYYYRAWISGWLCSSSSQNLFTLSWKTIYTSG